MALWYKSRRPCTEFTAFSVVACVCSRNTAADIFTVNKHRKIFGAAKLWNYNTSEVLYPPASVVPRRSRKFCMIEAVKQFESSFKCPRIRWDTVSNTWHETRNNTLFNHLKYYIFSWSANFTHLRNFATWNIYKCRWQHLSLLILIMTLTPWQMNEHNYWSFITKRKYVMILGTPSSFIDFWFIPRKAYRPWYKSDQIFNAFNKVFNESLICIICLKSNC